MMKFLHQKKILPRASLLLALVLVLSGCDIYGKVGGDDGNIPGGLPFQLQGKWRSSPGDNYVITDTEITYDGGVGISGGTNYTGTIRFVSNYSPDSGLIIIEYTVKPAYSGYNGKDFFAIYYKDLTANTMQMANATILGPNTCPDTATLEEAVEKFTRMQMGNYVDWSFVQPFTRQQN